MLFMCDWDAAPRFLRYAGQHGVLQFEQHVHDRVTQTHNQGPSVLLTICAAQNLCVMSHCRFVGGLGGAA